MENGQNTKKKKGDFRFALLMQTMAHDKAEVSWFWFYYIRK